MKRCGGLKAEWPMTRLKQTSRFDSVVIIVENLQDLKLSDCLRYHMRDTNAAKDLLYR